jgi:hypothetical protein
LIQRRIEGFGLLEIDEVAGTLQFDIGC